MEQTSGAFRISKAYFLQAFQTDYKALSQILQDEETMYAYEGAFSDKEVQEWLDRQIRRYKKWGFGLWAVILKETGDFIGQCPEALSGFQNRCYCLREALRIVRLAGGIPGLCKIRWAG